MTRFQLQLLLVLSIFHFAQGSTKFTIASTLPECTGDLQVTSFGVDCGGSYCTFGSDVSISSAVKITSNNLATDTTSVKVKGAGITIYEDQIDFCGCLSSLDGSSACPEAGSYSVDTFKFKIPGDADKWYNSLWWWGQTISVAVYFDFGGSSSTTQCTTSITLTEASRYGMVAGAVLVLGIGGILTGVRRRRKVATIQLSEEEGTMSHFEMMPNENVARV